MKILHTGFYLIGTDKDGNIVDWDGVHSRKSGASKALYIRSELGLLKPDREYFVIKVEHPKMSFKGINKSALSTMKMVMKK